ncbi:MAG: M48 family metallopeptidase [Chthonomonadales bacterium]
MAGFRTGRAMVPCLLLWGLLSGMPAALGQLPHQSAPIARSRAIRHEDAGHGMGSCRGSVPAIPPATPRIRTYNDASYALAFGSFLWEAAGWWLLLQFGLSSSLSGWACRRTRRLFWQSALFWSALSGLMTLWRLPISLAAFLLDRSYGFATMGPMLWLEDRLRGWAFGLTAIPAIWLAWILLLRSPRRWWLWLWAAAIPWTLFITILQPVFVDPAYNRFTPLPQGALRTQIARLARQAGVGNAQILVADASRRTTRANAYVTGIGPTRRIVLWNTTLHALPSDEILFIVAHELGHYVLGHMWWILAGNIAGSLLLLAILSRAFPWTVRRWGARWHLKGISDLAALPTALLLLHGLLFAQMPAACAFSRFLEHQADRYGLMLTHDNCAAARLFADFVRRDYADPDPPRLAVLWLYTHPPIRQRMQFALHYHPWKAPSPTRRTGRASP